MRILHYLPGLPPVLGGGMIKYALDLVEGERRLGHTVSILVPGAYTHLHRENVSVTKKKWKTLDCYYIVNPLPVSVGRGVADLQSLYRQGDVTVYLDFLTRLAPELVHVHSFMGLHQAFLMAAKQLGIPIVYTTHDYYGICPKATLLEDKSICTTTDGSCCAGCMRDRITMKKMQWEHTALYRLLKGNAFIHWLEYSQRLVPIKIYLKSLKSKQQSGRLEQDKVEKCDNTAEVLEYQKLQRYYRSMFAYVTYFHYNSTQTQEIFRRYLGEHIAGERILLRNQTVMDRRRQRQFGPTLRIGFIGYGEHKGFGLLREAMADMYAKGMQDIECHVYFNPKETMPAYIVSHAPYQDKNAESVYDNIDVLVLPSIWQETFGMVVLEAISYGVPVILSNQVGAKDLLEENNEVGMLVEPTKDALQAALEQIYCHRELLQKMNREICKWNINLDYENHIRKMLDMYQMVCNDERNKEEE